MKKLAAMLTLMLAVALAPATPAHAAGVRPCPTEDSSRCVWDARHRGNGEGRSIRAFRGDNYRYITHRRAHRLVRLWRQTH